MQEARREGEEEDVLKGFSDLIWLRDHEMNSLTEDSDTAIFL